MDPKIHLTDPESGCRLCSVAAGKRKGLDSIEDPEQSVLLVSGFVCQCAPKVEEHRNGNSLGLYLFEMFVGC